MDFALPVLTRTRTLWKNCTCSHMAKAFLKLQSSFTATTPSTSPNLACPSSSPAVLGLGLSISLCQLALRKP